ncbi:hypothetical protein BDV93DRAFT_35336 [Ceratobasidium sp. AG-I]|nr:hypothetical protein BDV93DRAFT_35336 [Ceratobasidium sp. AG-I]
MSKQAEGEHDKAGGLVSPAPVPFGRRAIMVAVVFALVASAVFRWAVVGIWKGEPLEVVPGVAGQGLWCGKYYEHGQPARSPGGNFPVPSVSPTPLLRFECWPGLRPYVSGLDTSGSVLLSANTVNTAPGIAYDSAKDGSVFQVKAQIDGYVVASGIPLSVGAPTSEAAFEWEKLSLAPRVGAYNLSCTATAVKSGKVFHNDAKVFYMPPTPSTIGGVIQTDGKTGGILVPGKGIKTPLLPFGFYTAFGGYLDTNLTILDEIKKEGFNLVHPIPTFDNATALELLLDRMEELGLWLIYDMRWSYKNLTSVRAEVEAVKKRKNLLAWYTADEPDGWEDPLDAPQKAADLINQLDGYHPVALVLNCADYYFQEYTADSQIILQDAYPVAINATWSTVWNTPCTPEVGDCGCDNCRGQMEDIAERVDAFQDRLAWEGRDKEVSIWSVPQAFGPESYWPRKPTPQELALEVLLAINHGSLGIMPWNESPSNPLMRPIISPLAKVFPTFTPYILGSKRVVGRPVVSGAKRIDATTWTVGGKTLLIALNLNNSSAQAQVSTNTLHGKGTVVFENGAQLVQSSGKTVNIQFQPQSSIAVVF